MDEKIALIEKIRELAKTEYYLQNRVKQYNKENPDEKISYIDIKKDTRLTLGMKQTGLCDFIGE